MEDFKCGFERLSVPDIQVVYRREADQRIITGSMAALDDGQVNPVTALAEALTNPTSGLGIPKSRIDEAGWQAAASSLHDERENQCLSILLDQKMRVPDAWDRPVYEEADKRLDDDDVNQAALQNAETNGIVFLDEIDKIAVSDVRGGSVSREGVQRDLLPLIEGTTVSTKHGAVNTDHILFIASGAFHIAKPSDLLPELQGRLPIRVELRALTEEDFRRILTETDNALTGQYTALMGTEGLDVTFSEDGIEAMARIAAEVNQTIENIGARRLYTVMERVFEELSFTAPDRGGDEIAVDAAFVEAHLGELSRSTDLSRYVL